MNGPVGGAQVTAEAEHWVQQAMIGEYVVPLRAGSTDLPQVTLIEEHGLEEIGTSDSISTFPKSAIPPGAKLLPVARAAQDTSKTDKRRAKLLQAVVIDPGKGKPLLLVIRAQIRGASNCDLYSNSGAYLRIHVALPLH